MCANKSHWVTFLEGPNKCSFFLFMGNVLTKKRSCGTLQISDINFQIVMIFSVSFNLKRIYFSCFGGELSHRLKNELNYYASFKRTHGRWICYFISLSRFYWLLRTRKFNQACLRLFSSRSLNTLFFATLPRSDYQGAPKNFLLDKQGGLETPCHAS